MEAFKEEAKKDISGLKDGDNFAEKQLLEKSQELAKAQAEIAKLTRKVQKDEEAVNETESKSLYLEAYSRRENIKFRPVTRILYGGGAGGANEAKVDQTTEMYFLLSDPYI